MDTLTETEKIARYEQIYKDPFCTDVNIRKCINHIEKYFEDKTKNVSCYFGDYTITRYEVDDNIISAKKANGELWNYSSKLKNGNAINLDFLKYSVESYPFESIITFNIETTILKENEKNITKNFDLVFVNTNDETYGYNQYNDEFFKYIETVDTTIDI